MTKGIREVGLKNWLTICWYQFRRNVVFGMWVQGKVSRDKARRIIAFCNRKIDCTYRRGVWNKKHSA